MTETEYNALIRNEILESLRFDEQTELNQVKAETLDFLLSNIDHFGKIFLHIKNHTYNKAREKDLSATPGNAQKFLDRKVIQKMVFEYYQNIKQEKEKTF